MKNKFIYNNHYFWRLPGYMMVLCLLFSINASAQKDTSKLKEVNVKASVAPKLQSAVPSQTITANEFDQFNALNVADAVQHFAGVIVKDYGGIGGLKTISVRGLSANYTSVLYDGVQINDAENGQIDLGKFNLNSIQSITLYNGQPANILQTARAFASASVLDIQTVKPLLTAAKPYTVTAGIKAGSFGLFNPYVQWQQRLNNNWSFIINSYNENASGRYTYLTNDSASITKKETRIGSDVAIQQVDGNLYWQKTDSSKFNLHVNYYNSNRGLPGAVISYTPPPFGQRLWNQDLFLQAGYEHVWKSGFHLLLNSKFSHNFLHYLDPNYEHTSAVFDEHYTQREFYQSAALSYHVLPNWEFSYAADMVVNNMDADLPLFLYPTRITLLNVLATSLVTGKFTFQANLLNSRISETTRTGSSIPNHNVYSPTIMATLKPFNDQDFQVRAFYKSIFRYPTFIELYYGVPNANLKPEFAHQYDMGLTYTKNLNGLLDYIALTTDVYYNHVNDKIVAIPISYYISTQNIGETDIKGIDATLQTQARLYVKYKASLSATYSYQQALNVTGPVTAGTYLNQLPYTPLNSASLNAGINSGTVGIYYNQLWASSRYYNNNNNAEDYMAPYALSSASVVYNFIINHSKIAASAQVNNLFNKHYEVVESYPMPGRSYQLSFQITI